MRRIIGLVFVMVIAVSLAYVPVASTDAGNGKSLFNSKAKKCKSCHKVTGASTKFKPVGPGLKGVGSRWSRADLEKWLSPNNVDLFGGALGEKGKIVDASKISNASVKDLLQRYKAAKKKDMKKSQMAKNFGPGKKGKAPKIQLTDGERGDIIDYLNTL